MGYLRCLVDSWMMGQELLLYSLREDKIIWRKYINWEGNWVEKRSDMEVQFSYCWVMGDRGNQLGKIYELKSMLRIKLRLEVIILYGY